MAGVSTLLKTVTEANEQGGQIPQGITNDKYRESCYFFDPEMIKDISELLNTGKCSIPSLNQF